MKKILILASVLLLSVSCSDNGKKAAEALYNEAQTAYDAGQYNDAKVLLDSIDHNYRKCIDVRKLAQVLMYKINLEIEKNNNIETAKLLEETSTKINEITQKYFTFEKSEYDELGRYIYNGTEVEKNVQRSYIHAAVDEYGVTQLISTYSGGKDINYTALRIIASNGESILTETIPYNDGSNYKYVIDGTHYESVTYKGEKDNGALAFVASHADDKGLKAVLIGENKEFPVAISAKEREALAISFELGVILSAQLQYSQQNKVAQGKILFFEEKLSTKK